MYKIQVISFSNYMEKDKRDKIINELIHMSSDIYEKIQSIVWESQEGQEHHYDRLPKPEQQALSGILNDANHLFNGLTSYSHWFIENR